MTHRLDLGTPDRHRHRDAEGNAVLREEETIRAGVRVARATSVIYRLKENGTINERQYRAAEEVRPLYEARYSTLVSPAYDGVPTVKTRFSRTLPVRTIEQNAEYSLTMKNVPAAFHDIIVAVVCHDRTPTEYAKRAGMNRHQAVGYLKAALDALVEARSKAA